MQRFTPWDAYEFARLGQELFDDIERLPCVTVALIDGDCFGGALDLVLAFDFRFATPRSRFAHPGARLGIVTGFGGTSRWRKVLTRRAANQLFLANRVLVRERRAGDRTRGSRGRVVRGRARAARERGRADDQAVDDRRGRAHTRTTFAAITASVIARAISAHVDAVGIASASAAIVTVAVAAPSVAPPVGVDSTTVNASLGSLTASLTIGTTIICDVTPSLKVSVAAVVW